ncbi:TPA: LeuA family protein [Staphylococcus aureus]|uniref:LeuA family protein n=1 Tax=Staphylococcus aureus TaxID=1280 RepID=UPI0028807E55|nr:LeuA family protein [Staphylococcus aureus]HDG5762172.1 hypothetical protein [Staphylococcus aureus]HDG5765002.1 hypothetical protein [Staphylococcus aureus]HDG5769651.1 hypothetical protein [Staphylococcus aureus]HDG5938534.1 hypothetical protein [Staphylococcus aureus]
MGNNKRKITFLDTTLRDGEQAPGNSMNYTKKLELALLLEESGIETIETGFPASSRDDFIATKMISESLKSSNFATFSRTKIEDIELSIQAGGTSNRHILMLVATGSDLHLEKKRKITREKGVEEVKRAVSFAKSRGIKNIAVGIEDASRSSREYINILIKTSIEFGANQIILADTTGYSTPNEMYNLVEFAKGCINESVKLSVHCHNDLGLAVINSYFAVLAGADEIQGTIGGIGERVGNTSLEQIIGLISYKGYHDNLYCEIKKEKLYKIYLKLTQFINLEENKNLPLFGKNVFSTAAGIHQQGILNDPNTYEFVKPNDWGRNRSFYIDKHSGRSMIKQVLNKIDRNKLNEKEINNLYKKYIENLSKSITYEELEYQIKIELGERIN